MNRISAPTPLTDKEQAGPGPAPAGRPCKVQVWEKAPYVPAAIRKMQHEHSAGLRVLRHVASEHPDDPFAQLVLFFQRFRIPAATGRKRQVSYKTEDRYFSILKRVLETLRKPLNMQVRNLAELSPRQVRAVTRHWEESGSSASSLATLNTVLRRFGIWIGKPDLAPLLAELVANPQSAKRSASRTQPRTWESSGIDPQDVFEAAEQECKVTAMQLRLAWAFGLRVEEQLMLRPAEAHHHDSLFITHGTKGGRLRKIRILHAWEAELLEQAKALAEAHPKKILAPLPPRRLHEARNHYYYICRKIGLTVEGRFRNTPYGARHSFAARRYRLESGLPAPVLGGGVVPRAIDHSARQAVAEEMGHGRASVTGAYLGTVFGMNALARRNHQRLVEREALLGTDKELLALAAAARLTTFCLVGDAATGEPCSVALVFCEAEEAMTDESIRAILARAGRLLAARCVLVDRRGVELPTFEVLALGQTAPPGPSNEPGLQREIDFADLVPAQCAADSTVSQRK